MTSLLLSNQIISLNLPSSLGGGVQNYNYFLELDLIYKQAITLPASINNKEVILLGEVWSTANMSNKTSGNSIAITWNNFSSYVTLRATSKNYTANAKIKSEHKFNFGNINNLQIMLSSWQSGSANASQGWNLNDGDRINPRAHISLYWN